MSLLGMDVGRAATRQSIVDASKRIGSLTMGE